MITMDKFYRKGRHDSVSGLTTRGMRSLRRVYDFIVIYKAAHDGNSPTFCEIMAGCSFSSKNTIRYYLVHLEDIGLIRCLKPDTGGRYNTHIEVVGGKWKLED